MDNWSYTGWAIVAFAAFFVGLSKTGIPGVGILAIGLFTLVIPARQSAGVVLPMLIMADLIAVWSYWKQARWGHLLKLFPWAIAGIVAGWLAMDHIDDRQTALLIGIILVFMAGFQMVRSFQNRRRAFVAETGELPAHGKVCTAFMGTMAGFTTMVANAAGPIMSLYLVAMRMPKMAFMGTAAWYFFLLNSFKVPFGINLGIITRESFALNLKLAPAVFAGALLGRWILPRLNQKVFEGLALSLALLAGLRLVWSAVG